MRRYRLAQIKLKPQPELIALITQSIEECPSTTLGEGGVIKQGFSEELDKMRLASKDARQYLASLEKQEREKTGIKSLKVGYNRVFGYYIEVSQANLPQVPILISASRLWLTGKDSSHPNSRNTNRLS